MSCMSCVNRIETSMQCVGGVLLAKVGLVEKTATVWYEAADVLSAAVLCGHVRSLGYEVTLQQEFLSTASSDSEASFTVTGMSCGSCAAHIESLLLKRAGITKASVNFASVTATVWYDPSVLGPTDIARVIEEAGYKASPQSSYFGSEQKDGVADVTILIDGMSCASCAAKIERELLKFGGVLTCSVNFATTTAAINVDPALISETAIVQIVTSLGYKGRIVAKLSSTAADETRKALERTREISQQWQRFVNSLFFTVMMLILMLVQMNAPAFQKKCGSFAAVFSIDVAQFCLATPVVFLFGRHFFEKAWIDLHHRSFTMDTLIAFGVGGAYVSSAATLCFIAVTGHLLTVSFDAAAMLLTFMLLGKYLEARAKRSTSSALIQLMSLVPPVATVVLPTGDVTIPSAAVRKGQRLRVLAGERIPVDGVVVEGASDVDEQLVTGEAVPRCVSVGDNVIGGTLNCQSVLIMDATRVGEETMLAQVLRTVQEAQNSKPAIQRIADKIAGVFVPIVVCYAIAALTTWLLLGYFDLYPESWRDGDTILEFSFQFFLASVVSACPCALGLATPTAIMVGTGVGASNGILIKAGTTLETCRKTTCVVLDKTGTITVGQQSVVLPSHESRSLSEEITLATLASVASLSTHPISKSIAHFAQDRLGKSVPLLNVTNCVTVPGKGLKATVQLPNLDLPSAALLGSPSFLAGEGVSLSPHVTKLIASQQGEGHTTVVLSIDNDVSYVVSLSDRPKREAASVIATLLGMGIDVYMVTGDNKLVADAVADQVNIPRNCVHAQVLPDEKANFVRDLQLAGRTVMFVGDGINDSPALATANIGVALGAGTEVAIEAADAVLIHNSLVDLLTLLKLSHVTVRRIYGNFVWACAYNAIMLPIAGGCLMPSLQFQLPPMAAGAAMVFSSLSVLASSLQLRCFTPCILDGLPAGGTYRRRHAAEEGAGLLTVTHDD